MPKQKDSALLRNLARAPLARVKALLADQKDLAEQEIQDSCSFSTSFWLALSVLWQDRSCKPNVIGEHLRILQNVLKSRDLLGFIESASELRFALVQEGSFEAACLNAKTRWLRSLVRLITTVIPSDLIVHPSPAFDAVATYLGWFKRLPVCIRPTAEAVDEYFEVDRRLSSIDFDEREYVADLREIWKEWFKDFELRHPFLPKHGPGSTADSGSTRSSKWSGLSWDTVARVCLRTQLERDFDLPLQPSSRVAKVVFVPKQAGKLRTICMEPAWLQYLQQGVADQLVNYMSEERHPLSKIVNIRSQDVNRRLCAAAFTERLATIDLSNASDCVSWRLIKRITFGLPLARYLKGTRSTSAILDGYEVEFDKFAPMGSALCFPVECILFASIVELAFRISNGQASQGHLSGCSVYGDDIICPADIYHIVVDILIHLGFEVNTSKSFSSGGYYESCGVEYLYGAMIRSIKHPRSSFYTRKSVLPEHVGMVTDMANTFLDSHYYDARRLLLKIFEEKYIKHRGKRHPFMSLMRFDERHCRPLIPQYGETSVSKKLQTPVRIHKDIAARPTKHRNDYQQWQSSLRPVSREDRRIRRRPVTFVDSRWTVRGCTFLAGMGHFPLLQEGEPREARVYRTGRLRYKLSFIQDSS